VENFRFTLFNNITLLIMALTVAIAAVRWLGQRRSNWPLVYYVVVAGFTFGFDGSLNKLLFGIGLACGLSIRFTSWPAPQWMEAAFFAYVLWRSIGLLLMW
jgi:hypothetical protein